MADKPKQTIIEVREVRKGISLGTVLAALLVLALVGVGSLVGVIYYLRSDKAKVERQLAELAAKQAQAEIDQKKAADNEKLTLARNRQDEVLAQVRSATNILFQLLAETKALAT